MPRHGAWATFGKVAASVIAVLAVSATAIVAYAAVDLVATVAVKPPVKLESEAVLENVPDIGAMEGGLNFVLVGSDKRPEDGAFGDPEEESAVLNDVTMLLHISQDHTHVEVVSFPRDMYVSVPECPDPNDPGGEPLDALSSVKMNEVLSWGGLGCVASTLEQLTGVTIPVGGIVEFYGVAALSSAVGGVDVCVVERIDDDYTGLHLDPGTYALSGMDALAFLRTRHGVGDGSDLGRISSQQTFLASLMRTLQSSGTLGDPVKLYSIAKAVLSNMTLSSALQNPAQLMSIATHAAGHRPVEDRVRAVPHGLHRRQDGRGAVGVVVRPERRAGWRPARRAQPGGERGLRVRDGHRPECAARTSPRRPPPRIRPRRPPTRRSPRSSPRTSRARRPRKSAARAPTRADRHQHPLRVC